MKKTITVTAEHLDLAVAVFREKGWSSRNCLVGQCLNTSCGHGSYEDNGFLYFFPRGLIDLIAAFDRIFYLGAPTKELDDQAQQKIALGVENLRAFLPQTFELQGTELPRLMKTQ